MTEMGEDGMRFRLSHKLNARIKAGPLGTLPLHENSLTDWSAHLFVAGRTPHILLSNTRSLYSTVMHAKVITSVRQFTECALAGIRELMEGHKIACERFIAPAGDSVRFSKALNRSVTGSMNELIAAATLWLAEGGLSPQDVGGRLNDILLSAVAPDKSAGYGRPRDVFEGLVSHIEDG